MKNIQTTSIQVLFAIMLLSINIPIFSQGVNWRFGGNNNVGLNDFIGTKNNADFSIITNNQLRINVSKDGTINFFGNVRFYSDTTFLQGLLRTDSLKLSRLLPQDGDSIIRIGSNSLNININNNSISWTPVPNYLPCPSNEIGGITIANGVSVAEALNSMALGNDVVVSCDATNSFAVGSGVTNNNPNSFLLGFGSNTLYADATGVGINIASHANELDVNGRANIRVVDQDLTNSLNQIIVYDPSNNGLLKYRDASSFVQPPANMWEQGGNFSFPNLSDNILGTMLAYDLRIFTNGQLSQFIDGSNTPARGYIGINTDSPNERFTINDGNINIRSSSKGYMIGDNDVLQYRGALSSTPSPTNIFVGVGAGASNTYVPAIEGINNTFVGGDAGRFNTIGFNNTSVGSLSLHLNQNGNRNVAVGHKALYSNISSDHNTAVGVEALYHSTAKQNTALGYRALFTNTIGICNTANGYTALYFNTEGHFNTANGVSALSANTIGIQNTAVGGWSLRGNTSGNYNTALGYNARTSAPDLENATAIGTNAYVGASNCMVLGSIENINGAPQGSTVKVGIGTTTPQNRLEIKDGTPDNSGLRLTNLTAATTPMPNPGSGVLAVNGDGDVVYVEIESYLKKIEVIEARLQRLEELLAMLQPTQTTSISSQ